MDTSQKNIIIAGAVIALILILIYVKRKETVPEETVVITQGPDEDDLLADPNKQPRSVGRVPANGAWNIKRK